MPLVRFGPQTTSHHNDHNDFINVAPGLQLPVPSAAVDTYIVSQIIVMNQGTYSCSLNLVGVTSVMLTAINLLIVPSVQPCLLDKLRVLID